MNVSTHKNNNKEGNMPVNNGFPLKISTIVVIVLIWNILFFIDLCLVDKDKVVLGIYSLVAIGLILIISLLTLLSGSFQKLILKPNRKIKEIKRHVYLIIFISATILISMIFHKFI